MGLLDDFGKKVTDVGQKTLQKTKEMSGVARINSLISQNEGRLNNLYCQIGKLYVSVHGNDSEENFKGLVDSAVEIEKQNFEYRMQIQNIKGLQRCEKCGTEVPRDFAFCSACGAAMPKPETTANPNDSVICPGCGALVAKEMSFCTTCGCDMNISAVPAQESQESLVPAEDVTVEVSAGTCPQCGTKVAGNHTFCSICGTKL